MDNRSLICPKCGHAGTLTSELALPYGMHRYGYRNEMGTRKFRVSCTRCGFTGKPAYGPCRTALGAIFTEEEAERRAEENFIGGFGSTSANCH